MSLKSLRSHILIGLILACAGIAVLLYFNFFNLRLAQYNTDTIKEKQEDLRLAHEILIDLQNIETGQRGFVLTGDSSFLGLSLIHI